jgi:hypothetical protein
VDQSRIISPYQYGMARNNMNASVETAENDASPITTKMVGSREDDNNDQDPQLSCYFRSGIPFFRTGTVIYGFFHRKNFLAEKKACLSIRFFRSFFRS